MLRGIVGLLASLIMSASAATGETFLLRVSTDAIHCDSETLRCDIVSKILLKTAQGREAYARIYFGYDSIAILGMVQGEQLSSIKVSATSLDYGLSSNLCKKVSNEIEERDGYYVFICTFEHNGRSVFDNIFRANTGIQIELNTTQGSSIEHFHRIDDFQELDARRLRCDRSMKMRVRCPFPHEIIE